MDGGSGREAGSATSAPGAGSPGGSGLPWILGGATLAGIAGWLAVAAASPALDGAPDLRPGAAGLVAAAAVALIGLPGAGAVALARRLRAGGRAARAAPLLGTAVGLAGVAGIVGVQVATPRGVRGVLEDRGAWLLDVARGRGPFGSAARPQVARLTAELAAPLPPDRAAELLCEDSARAAADAIAAALRDGADGPRPDALARLAGRSGADALRGAVDLAAAVLPTGPLGPLAPADLAPTDAPAARAAIALGSSEGAGAAVHDGAAWRVCAPPGRAASAGAAFVADARARRLAESPPPPPPDPDEATIRALVREVAAGRASWALGVPGAASWPGRFAPPLAEAEADAILAWCGPVAAGDPALAGPVAALAQLPPDGSRLEAAARACAGAGAARIAVETARGTLPLPAEARRVLAESWGDRAGADAAIGPDPADPAGRVALLPDGSRLAVARGPDGAWRVTR